MFVGISTIFAKELASIVVDHKAAAASSEDLSLLEGSYNIDGKLYEITRTIESSITTGTAGSWKHGISTLPISLAEFRVYDDAESKTLSLEEMAACLVVALKHPDKPFRYRLIQCSVRDPEDWFHIFWLGVAMSGESENPDKTQKSCRS
ncbi:hypothetical protein BDZ89DRAFT_1067575, partial [Hymenopellis radicata]